jgi:1-acyl-sn-glycerol-3-phosphate acyltransferase
MQTAIEDATNRLVKAGREEQVKLIGFSAPVVAQT